ncbi:MAG: alpha/beta hydrolase-fold protein [Candidatus Sumerlaeota bacterium]|nr:alpha/beta hydrolase-fold protein [Candidatus Sumerlaeota bacterium]
MHGACISLTGFVPTPMLCWASPASGLAARRRPGEGEPPKIVSPEVHADRSVTFRFAAPNAKEVKLVSPDMAQNQTPMEKGEGGVWSATVGPLAPEIYSYQFAVDGVRLSDPNNGLRKSMQAAALSLAIVPGEKPMLFEEQDLPRGAVTIHSYESKTLGKKRRLYVYTPPDYLTSPKEKYPVLYLLHGSGDDESAWSMIGRANVILDNLIAQGKAKPMIVAMFNGHAMPPGTKREEGQADKAEVDLAEDVLPFVESRYRVIADRERRAVAGLSMGGRQAADIGLNHLDKFAWVGCFSGAINMQGTEWPLPEALKNPEQARKGLRLLWIACGKDDKLIDGLRKFSQQLDERKIPHVLKETEGRHHWPVWRKYLAEFAPMLFVEQARTGK